MGQSPQPVIKWGNDGLAWQAGVPGWCGLEHPYYEKKKKKENLKGLYFKHRHRNKGVPASKASIMGNTLLPFLGNEHGWRPLKCLYSNTWNTGNKWGNRGQCAAAGLWKHPRGVVRIHTTEVLQWMETCPTLGIFKYRPGWHKGRVILWEWIHEDLPSDERQASWDLIGQD